VAKKKERRVVECNGERKTVREGETSQESFGRVQDVINEKGLHKKKELSEGGGGIH